MEANKDCSIGAVDQEMGSIPMFKDAAAVEKESLIGRRDLNLARMVVAEMVGTFILIFAVCGIEAITELTKGAVGLLEYAATGGFATIVAIFSVGAISGAHINPSVTVAFATIGQFPWSKVPIYVVAQMLGSIFAAYAGKSIYGMQADFAITQPLHGLKTAFWAELIGTFFIMFLASALSSNSQVVKQLSGVAIGVAIALAVLITGPISGGSMNPARSFGPAIISGKFDDIWLYLLAPTIGAVAGALLFRLLKLQCRQCSPSSSQNAILPTKGVIHGNPINGSRS